MLRDCRVMCKWDSYGKPAIHDLTSKHEGPMRAHNGYLINITLFALIWLGFEVKLFRASLIGL